MAALQGLLQRAAGAEFHDQAGNEQRRWRRRRRVRAAGQAAAGAALGGVVGAARQHAQSLPSLAAQLIFGLPVRKL